MNNEIYQIKVIIPYWDRGSSKPNEYSPYRIIEVEPDLKLSQLSEIILKAFNFIDSKPYGFYYNNINNYIFAKEGYVMRFEDEDEWNTFDPDNIYGDVEKAEISDILTRKGKKWLMLFDYLKEWHFHIFLVEKYKKVDNIKYPQVIEEYMKPPIQSEFP